MATGTPVRGGPTGTKSGPLSREALKSSNVPFAAGPLDRIAPDLDGDMKEDLLRVPVKVRRESGQRIGRKRYIELFKGTRPFQCGAAKVLMLSLSWLHQFDVACCMRCCMYVVRI